MPPRLHVQCCSLHRDHHIGRHGPGHTLLLLFPPPTPASCSYQDELRDLLNPSKNATKLNIRHDEDKGISVDGALKLPAASVADVSDAIAEVVGCECSCCCYRVLCYSSCCLYLYQH